MPTFIGDPFGLPTNDNLSYAGSTASDFEGRGGADYISGGSGNDVMYGDYKAGENLLDGGDKMYGNGGNDTMYGGGGNDTMYGGSGADYLNGGSGNDSLFGGDNNDDLWGGSGNDSLDGGNHDDELRGGSGSDVLIGGSGQDYLRGGADDLLEVDVLTGGVDSDVFVLTNADRTDNVYDNNLGFDRAVIRDWRQGGAQDKIYLAAESAGRLDYQLSSGKVLIFEKGITDAMTGLSTPSDLLAEITLGTSSGLTSSTFLSNVQANVVLV
jgi:Ca2+-binding RTX toxin-like protein